MEKKKDVEALAEKAYELGYKYERELKGCGQCLIGAVQDALDMEGDDLFKAATAFAGGIGLTGDSACGAYAGGVLLLGHRIGREKKDFEDAAGIRFKTYALAKKWHDTFIETYGSVNCRDIQTKVFGRPYYLNDQDEFMKFEEAGGHEDKCPEVVGLAARWLVGLFAEEGLLE
jgi:C_GCAxxG_C_C family probable redox protein